MKTVGQNIRTNILVGLLLLAPIVFTAAVVKWLFNWFTGLFLGFFPGKLWQTDYQILFRFAALAAILIVLFFLGLLARNVLGKRLYKFWDGLLTRIPLVSKIYLGIRQIFEALLTNRNAMFQEVVLVEYPRTGHYMIGFVSGIVPAEIGCLTDRRDGQDEVVSLFIPTTPNPTSGWLCIVPRSRTQRLAMSPGDAMKVIMSGGATFSGEAPATQTGGLFEKVGEWVSQEQATAKPG